MARKAVAGRKPPTDQVKLAKRRRRSEAREPQPMAYSIRAFCLAHGISIDTYFRMQREKPPCGPAIMKVGARTLISHEAAAAWRRARETEAQQQRREHKAAAEVAEANA